MMGLRPLELVIIFAVIVLLFGATRLPQLGSSIGQAIRNFKRGFGEAADQTEEKKDNSTLAGGQAQTPGKAPAADKVGSRQA
jgi:sec-independent protein translocase protein TatA